MSVYYDQDGRRYDYGEAGTVRYLDPPPASNGNGHGPRKGFDPDEEGPERVESRPVRLLTASEVEMDRPRWAWDCRMPVGGVTLVAGREGQGKTAFVAHLAARLTRGDLPGEWHGHPADVVYVGVEDDRSTVIVPRLVAAGADLDYFHFVDLPLGGGFSVDVDIDHLRGEIEDAGLNVALVVLDPLDSHLGKVDSHKKAEVQATIGALAGLAQDLRCAAVGIAHLNKGETRELLARIVGSVGFTTAARSVLGIGEHPDDPDDRLCALAKANMTDRTAVPAVRFRVEGTTVPHPTEPLPIATARVVVLGEEEGVDPDSLISGGSKDERTALEDACAWLRDVLDDGPMTYAELSRLATGEGIGKTTLWRAKKRVGVDESRDQAARGRPSTWSLPFGSTPPAFGSEPSETKPVGTKPKHTLTSTNTPTSGGLVPVPGNGTKSNENGAAGCPKCPANVSFAACPHQPGDDSQVDLW